MTATEQIKCGICGDEIPNDGEPKLFDTDLRCRVCSDCADGIYVGCGIFKRFGLEGCTKNLTDIDR